MIEWLLKDSTEMRQGFLYISISSLVNICFNRLLLIRLISEPESSIKNKGTLLDLDKDMKNLQNTFFPRILLSESSLQSTMQRSDLFSREAIARKMDKALTEIEYEDSGKV